MREERRALNLCAELLIHATRIALVWNPISGQGKGRERAEIAKNILEKRNLEKLTLCETKAAGDAREFANKVAHDHDVILSLGGDGTVNEVVTGVHGQTPEHPRQHTPLILPLRGGTSNILAMELKIPNRVDQALRLLDEGTVISADRGLLNGSRSFVLWVGIGLDGEIVRRVSQARKGTMSKFTYFRPITSTLWNYNLPEIEVEADGKTLPGPFAQVLVAKATTYAWLLRISKRAAVTSGQFVVAGFRAPTKAHLLLFAGASMLNALDRFGPAYVCEATNVKVHAKTGVAPLQIDGDAAGVSDVEIKIIPASVPLIVPKKTADKLPSPKRGSS